MSEMAELSPSPDDTLAARIRSGDVTSFEQLMRRYNQRLYRIARAIVKDDEEAEDVLQEGYIQAYLHLDQFEGRSQLSTWLSRIVIHEALARRRKASRPLEPFEDHEHVMSRIDGQPPDPERLAYAGELRGLIERSIDGLPDAYRLVFVCRDVEGLSTAETAAALELGEEAVKTRLHRARAMLRRDLLERAGATTPEAFGFYRPRCDAVVQAVLHRLARMIM